MAAPVLALEATEVLAALARVERSDATFEETRYIGALTAPLVRRGTLRYARPAELEMVVETPVRERIRIAGPTLTIEGRNGVREIRLADMPAIAGWVESVRATLAGDASALSRHFTVRASGDPARWQLDLTPLSTELAAVVTRVSIEGTGAQIGRIEVAEASGDRSVMIVSPGTRQAMTHRQGMLLALALVVAAGIVYALRHVTLDSDYSAFLPSGSSDTQRALMHELREGFGSRVILIALDGAPPPALAEASRKLAAALEKSPQFRYVSNGAGGLGEREVALVTEHRYALSDRLDTREPFSPEALRAALEARLESLAGSAGVLEKPFLASDPTADTRRVLTRMTPIKAPQRIDGVWFDAEGKRALLVAQTQAFGSDLEGQARAIAVLEQALRCEPYVRVDRHGLLESGHHGRAQPSADRRRRAHALDCVYGGSGGNPRLGVSFAGGPRTLSAARFSRPARRRDHRRCACSARSTALPLRSARRCWAKPSTIRPTSSRRCARACRRKTSKRAWAACFVSPCSPPYVVPSHCCSADFPGLAQLGALTVAGVLVAGAATIWALPHVVPAGWRPPPPPRSSWLSKSPVRLHAPGASMDDRDAGHRLRRCARMAATVVGRRSCIDEPAPGLSQIQRCATARSAGRT